ncbi:MAG: CDP-alcohol phosphatidyltransferase family protein [Rhodospirillales bacterium]|nr:CDP-alcohol phosphatidyltransferase family protein [Rhodospirillales bacterium]
MTQSPPDASPMVIKRPVTLFPLIRQISAQVSPRLARLPITANQVTAVSLVVGLAGNWYIAQGGFRATLIGAGLFFLCYVLDNSDGEVARIKKQESEFGDKFDTLVDWLVHATFFAALGYGVEHETGNVLWLWLGWCGALGSSINYFIGLVMDARFRGQIREENEEAGADQVSDQGGTGGDNHPSLENWQQWTIFAFRELSRADFCFIVLALAVFDATWILLPTAAVGAHAYWATQFIRGARDHHV